MFSFVKRCVASLVSSEMAACKNRYNNKCNECRLLSEKIQKMETDAYESESREEGLNSQIDRLKAEVGQKDFVIEARDNQIKLTDLIVERQLQIIMRDIEMRRLEHVDAHARVKLAADMSNFKEETKDNGIHESDINYRPGRQ